jgi:lambda repressor-like predicted transcriptional regulator
MSNDRPASVADFLSDLGSAVRANPLPSALIGMGLLWLFTGGKSSVKAGLGGALDGVAHLGSRGAEMTRGLGRSVGDTVASARDGSAAAAQKAADVAFSLNDSAPAIGRQFFATARTNLADLMQRQPLLLGAIGLAVGAGVAASVGPTAAETDLLGDASTNFQEGVRNLAAAATHRAAVVADGVTTTVAQEARVQGLSSSALKQTASEAGSKVERVLGHAAERMRSRIN